MSQPTVFQLMWLAALRGAAEEIVGLWWTGPYAPGKVAAVESIICRHLEEFVNKAERVAC